MTFEELSTGLVAVSRIITKAGFQAGKDEIATLLDLAGNELIRLADELVHGKKEKEKEEGEEKEESLDKVK
ncbi:MAG TPA: hypothetical protein VLY82_02725 [Nitrososphaerales archaeon]|nr:hypothetical protein [Nitrososphaerales archaeon]